MFKIYKVTDNCLTEFNEFISDSYKIDKQFAHHNLQYHYYGKNLINISLMRHSWYKIR